PISRVRPGLVSATSHANVLRLLIVDAPEPARAALRSFSRCGWNDTAPAMSGTPQFHSEYSSFYTQLFLATPHAAACSLDPVAFLKALTDGSAAIQTHRKECHRRKPSRGRPLT